MNLQPPSTFFLNLTVFVHYAFSVSLHLFALSVRVHFPVSNLITLFCMSFVQQLSENWNRLKTVKRTVIHLPSLGYAQNIRQNVAEFDIIQNQQMARLCDVRG